jgi:CBS domain containing-hemolysin-like protein
MTELHESGFSRFPVYDQSQNDIVGMLMLRNLINAKHGGTVKDYCKKDLQYIHEDQDLYSALAAMLKTQQHLFIVVNSFEEYVGVIGLEDVLEQLIGLQIVDEFDSHDNMREVAARMAQFEHKKLQHPEEDLPVDPDQTDLEADDTI